MTIKFIKERSFWWPVFVQVPVDGGKKERHECAVKVGDHNSTDYLQALSKGDKEFVEYLCGLIADWKGIEDEEGAPIPCTEENKVSVFSRNYMLSGLVDALRAINTSEPETKN